jgi:hypothetical protein
MVVDGWTIEGRAMITLKPAPSVGPAGWLILNLDVVVRPAIDEPASPETKEWVPLSLDDLVALIYIPLSSLLDELAPTLLARIGDSQPLAIGVLLLPNGDELTRYARLDHYAQRRVDGATGPDAIDWQPSSLAEVATPDRALTSCRPE